jgi:hypothetical protein
MDAIIIVSDTHIGNDFGLCPPEGLILDGGKPLGQSKFQAATWRFWQDCWDHYVPSEIKKAKKITLVHNGDVVDGHHHDTNGSIANIKDQEKNAVAIFKPLVERFDSLYMVRGTEAHGGIGETSTERVAAALGAVVDKDTGDSSRQELWLEDNGVIMQFAHHISSTNSAAYETSAPMRELVAVLIESAQWGRPLPQIVVRSHRHRYTRVPIPTERGDIELVVTPAWQLKTPYFYKIDRTRMPHIGILVILIQEDGTWQIKRKLYQLPQPVIEKV